MRKSMMKSYSDTDINRLGGGIHENKLKSRTVWLDNMSKDLNKLVPRTRATRLTLRKRVADLQRQKGAAEAASAVCMKRMELRAQRPKQELFKDGFDEALTEEQRVCLAVQGDLLVAIQAGHALTKPLETANHEMQSAKHTFQTDRTGATDNLVNSASTLAASAEQYCRDADQLLQAVQREMQNAWDNTNSNMKQQIADTYALRKQIGDEKDDTEKTILKAERHLDNLKKQLKVALAMPERAIDFGGDGQNDKLTAKGGVLGCLRAKIKASAYTGPGGRDFMTTFARFDRDRSGELDEDEIRIALRTACKIPPSAVTDVEICALCELLDEDNSGTISIAELVDFILADVLPDELTKEIKTKQSHLDSLKAAQEETIYDFRSKTRVWRINENCSKVTAIKAQELDKFPSMIRQKKTSVAMRHRSAIASERAKGTTPGASRRTGATYDFADQLAMQQDGSLTGESFDQQADAVTNGQVPASMQVGTPPRAARPASAPSPSPAWGDSTLQSSASSQSSRPTPSGKRSRPSSAKAGAGPTPKAPFVNQRIPSEMYRNLLLT
jgi:hypothetical protein